MLMPLDLPLPCPLDAGWDLIRTEALPREAKDGRAIGGFSAAAYQPQQDRLWLLSDSPYGHLIPWGGLAKLLQGTQTKLTPGPRLLLRDRAGEPLPEGFDGEGLVLDGNNAWIVSEGQRTPERPARLIRIDLATGRQQQTIPLPDSWQASPGRGLAVNKGPESLTALSPSELLLAAERPLLQSDDPSLVSMARVRQGTAVRAEGALQIRPLARTAGLTDLLALPRHQRLLALVRGYQPPLDWTARLLLYPYPIGSAAPPLQPLHGWDLLTAGLPPDNWEALAVGPQLSDGRTTLVLASDDNFNPLQSSWVAVMAPRRTDACRD